MHRIIALLLALGVTSPASADCAQPQSTQALKAEAMLGINGYRQSAGLAALSADSKLASSAQAHACDMARQGRHSHVGSNGSDLVRRLKSAGYRFRAAVENVGKFQSTTKAADWWYKSSGHRANMLSSKIGDVGLGVALGKDGQYYWVMVGGRAK